MVVLGRARAIVVGVGANTAVGSIRDSMLQTGDVSITKSSPVIVISSWE